MRLTLLVAAAAALVTADIAHAQQVSFFNGAAPGGNCIPFNCRASYNGQTLFTGMTGYQQVFGSSAFSGPVSINSVQFYPGTYGGYDDSGTYDFYFSTTSAGVNALSTNLQSNVTGTNEFFGRLVLNGNDNSAGLFFSGTQPYVYDPSAGNLLMTIAISNWSGTGNGTFEATSVNTCSRAVNASYDGNTDNFADGTCLHTTLNVSPAVVATPEPSSMALLGTGLMGLIPMVQRKRRK